MIYNTCFKCFVVDCGKLNDPANGGVTTIGGTTFESLASYSCNDGYILSYPVGRTCLSTCQWSGEEPRCEPEPVCGKQGKSSTVTEVTACADPESFVRGVQL